MFTMAELCDECGEMVTDPFETACDLDAGVYHKKCFEKKSIREGCLIPD